MFNKTLPFLMLLTLSFAGTLALSSDADARSLTESARSGAVSAHQLAARQSSRAQAINARIYAEAAAFNAAMSSGDANRKLYGKRKYIGYLNSLKRALADADYAHANAIRAFTYYRRVSQNNAVVPTINALTTARNGFAVSISQVDARIISARAAK